MKNQKLVMSAAILSAALWSCGGTPNTTDGGSKTDAGATAATCASYCTTLAGNCKTTSAQYSDEPACLGSCSGMPPGSVGATSGNSLECRAYHAKAAATDAATHCSHAGPAGDGTANCGSNCDSFCSLATNKCAGTFDSTADCLIQCATFADNEVHYNSSLTTGDNFGCRMYHLTVASTNDTLKATHCPHIQKVSSTCK